MENRPRGLALVTHRLSSDVDDSIRCRVTYSGWVQGVGFREATRRLASQFEVTGYVQNRPDGTVRLVAEGQRAEVDRFLAALSERMSDNIRDVEIERLEPSLTFALFEIRH